MNQPPTTTDLPKSTRADAMYEHEAAEFLGITQTELRALVENGTGPLYCNTKPIRIYLTADLMEWKKTNTVDGDETVELTPNRGPAKLEPLSYTILIRMEAILKKIAVAESLTECRILAKSALCDGAER